MSQTTKKTTTARYMGAVAIMAALAVGAAGAGTAAEAQDATEDVMVAAGSWALDRLEGSSPRLDPHRTGAGRDAARVRRVAQRLGAELATLDDVRRCTDVMDPSTCELTTGPLLAIAAPEMDGERARVRVYGWHRSGSPRQPVEQRSWDLVLERSGGGWRVVGTG